MATVTVEVADLAAAARGLADGVADPLVRQVGVALVGVLAGGGMAGDDPAGVQWAAGYDRVAPVAIRGAEDVINSCYRVSAMLGATARNYARAEAASTVRGHHLDPGIASPITTPPDDLRIELPSALPSAAGGGGTGGPPGWHLIAHHLGGYLWPNGHQDQLRAAAAGWRASAHALQDHTTAAAFVDLLPLVDRLREGPDIATICTALSEHLDTVARAHHGLAHACFQLASHIDHAHARIEHELGELLAWTAGIQAIGAVASIFTFGAAEAPTQAGQAARIAATVSTIISILQDFTLAVRTVLAEITPIAGAVADVRSAVAWLHDLRIVQVEVTAVPGLRVYQVARIERAGSDAATTTEIATEEETALESLASEASTAGTGRARWTSGKKLREHFRKHKGEFDYATADEYADAAAAFYDRAKVEGLPMKVDEEGDVLVYERSTNTFGVYSSAGRTRTMYKPEDGLKYWNEQRGVLR